MRICRICVENFRNFKHLDVKTGEQLVIVGENKVGKTNLLHALRLVLDPSLPDSVRQLRKTDFWDGLKGHLTKDTVIRVSVDLTDFEDDEDLLAILAEHIVEVEPLVARLTYLFRPKVNNPEYDPSSEVDYEFLVFGGDREENRIGYELRRRIPLDLMPALRDAEGDLAAWTRSPLRPLLNRATEAIDRHHLTTVSEKVREATGAVLDIPHKDDPQQKPLRALEKEVYKTIKDFVGERQALQTALGFSATDPEKLLQSIRLLIDGGKRTVGDASLGSANLLYITLLSIQINQLVAINERSHTFLAIEEPEAHLHPHLQRLVYRDFLSPRAHLADNKRGERRPQTLLLTTHSPHILSVAPLSSIVLLKAEKQKDEDGVEYTHTVGLSAGALKLDANEVADLERYLDVNRGELLFARGVILVEGTAEEYLVPAFASLHGYPLDEYGITVCSVSGTNFIPYVKLLGKQGFDIPFAVITDRDPRADGGEPLGKSRVMRLLKHISLEGQQASDGLENGWETMGKACGIFVNQHTLEIDLFDIASELVCSVLEELTENREAKARVQTWRQNPCALDQERFLKDIEEIGKGRFAQRLASRVKAVHCPSYIREAIEYVAAKCQ